MEDGRFTTNIDMYRWGAEWLEIIGMLYFLLFFTPHIFIYRSIQGIYIADLNNSQSAGTLKDIDIEK